MLQVKSGNDNIIFSYLNGEQYIISSVNLKELTKGNFGRRLYTTEFTYGVTALLRITKKYIRTTPMFTSNLNAQEFPGWMPNSGQDCYGEVTEV